MGENEKKFGEITWTDITTENPEKLKNFYENVFGWKSEEFKMNDGNEQYSDYVMKSPNGKIIAGICHAKGPNTDLPAQWIHYITVENVEEMVEKTKFEGGKTVKNYYNSNNELIMAILQDPAGAIFGIAKPQS